MLTAPWTHEKIVGPVEGCPENHGGQSLEVSKTRSWILDS